MPIRSNNKYRYSTNWKEIRAKILRRAKNQCEWCSVLNHKPHPITGSHVVLAVAHLNHDPADNRFINLAALCNRCHLRYDGAHHAASRRLNWDRARGQLYLF